MFSFSSSMVFIIAVITAFITIYRYLTRTFDYWSKRGIPGPRPFPLLGTAIYEFIGMKCDYEKQWVKCYGKIYGMFRGKVPYLTIADPELVNRIMVKDFNCFMDRGVQRINDVTNQHLFRCNGDQWRRLRPIMSPMFSLGRMRQMYPMIGACVHRLSQELDIHAKDKSDVDMKQLIGRFVQHVVCACSLDIDADTRVLDELVVNARRIFDFKLLYQLSLALLPLSAMRFFSKYVVIEANVGNEHMIDIGRQLMAKMSAGDNRPTNASNLVRMLLNVQREGKDTNSGKHITDDEILAEVWLFLFGNYAMTGTILSSLVHTLAVNEDIQQRLYEELCECYADSESAVDYKQLDSLPYLEACVCEALRLYLPPLRVPRVAAHDYKVGDTGLTIEKGMSVDISIYAIHRNEEYFPNADQFIPDRFLPENKDKIVPNTFLPFALGPRACMGNKMATMQMKSCLAHIVRKFHFYTVPATDIPMKVAPHTGFIIPVNVIVGVEQRYE